MDGTLHKLTEIKKLIMVVLSLHVEELDYLEDMEYWVWDMLLLNNSISPLIVKSQSVSSY